MSFFLTLLVLKALAEPHGGEGGSLPQEFFDSVGKSQKGVNLDLAKELESCHYFCGPNKQRFILHYFCKANEGQIFKNDKLLIKLPNCRNNSAEIICGDGKTGFTLYGPGFSKARGQYQSEPLGSFFCKNINQAG